MRHDRGQHCVWNERKIHFAFISLHVWYSVGCNHALCNNRFTHKTASEGCFCFEFEAFVFTISECGEDPWFSISLPRVSLLKITKVMPTPINYIHNFPWHVMNHSYRKIKGVCKKQKSTGVEFTAWMSSYIIQDIKHVITNTYSNRTVSFANVSQNPLHSKYFGGNKSIYLWFLSVLHTDVTLGSDIFPRGNQWSNYFQNQYHGDQ